jgi:hypothetical protein
MTAAINPKSPKRFDVHPRLARVARKKAPPAALDDDPLLYRDEKAFRAALWDGLAKLARDCNSWIVTPPGQGRVQIQLAPGSDLLTRLAAFPRYPIMKLGKTSRLVHGKFMDVDVAQVELWRGS